MSKKHKNQQGLWPAHYDPFGLDRPHLPVPKPQPPLLVVIEDADLPNNPPKSQPSGWLGQIMWVLIILYAIVFALSLIHHSQSPQTGIVYDPLLLIQNKIRVVK